MKRSTKLIIGILIVIIIGIVAVLAGSIFTQEDLSSGGKNILVCAIDETEPRPGMGACDMAFLVHLDDGGIRNYTPVYPHGMTHPSVAEPSEYQAMGAGSKLLLHDSFYWDDKQQCMQYAKEIVEANTNYTVDAVIAVNSQALDNIISSAGTLKSNGEEVNATGLDFIREEENNMGMTRGDSVMTIVNALMDAAKDPDKRNAMLEATMSEYNAGHIAMYPEGSFVKLLASKGVKAMLGQ
ncbi:MAG: DUF4012 domain-containing protein [Methanobrevibacter sp.]|nr:DUF4012 domain-containing protein [Methanobrevibacter sp.]